MLKLIVSVAVCIFALSVDASLPSNAIQRLRKIFEKLDANGDGFATPEEIHAFANTGKFMSKEEWQELIMGGDQNMDGKIDFEEFVEYYESILDMSAKKIFKQFDTDNKYSISLDKLPKLGREIFKKSDTNNDGVVRLDEFLQFVKLSFGEKKFK